MKKFALLILLFLVTALSVNAVDLTLNTPQSVIPGTPATFTLAVTNPTAAPIPSVTFTSTTLTGPSTLPGPTIGQINNLVTGTPQNVQFTVPTSASTLPGTYTATITATEAGNPTTSLVNYALVVQPKAALTIDPADVKLFGEPGDRNIETTFQIRNTGNVALTNVMLSTNLVSPLKDTDNNELKFTISPTSIASIAPGQATNIKIIGDIESGFEKKTFDGTLTVAAAQLPGVTAPLTFGVKPLACIAGNRGDIRVDVQNPDDDDEFPSDENIPVEVDVENKGSDARIILKAALYNNDKDRIEDTYTSGSRNIDKGDENTYKFNLKFSSKAKADDDYTIYFKAYESGDDEKVNCNDAESTDVQVEEIEDKVVIDSFTLSPVSATCGDDVYGSIRIVNKGTNDADVRTTIKNAELGINDVTPTVQLDPSGDTGDDRVNTFSFKIPANAKDKTYTVQALVDYNGFSVTQDRSIVVSGCGPKVTTGGTVITTPTGGSVATPTNNPIIYTPKTTSFGEMLRQIPSYTWIMVNVVLGLLILLLIVGIARSGKKR